MVWSVLKRKCGCSCPTRASSRACTSCISRRVARQAWYKPATIAYTSTLNVHHIVMPSHTPLKNVCGVRHNPTAHFRPRSKPAHATAVTTAMGTCVAMSAAGRRIRTAHAAKAHTGAVKSAQHHHPVNCQARIQLQDLGSELPAVWKCIWIANRSATAVQAPQTINARFMSLIVAWYDPLDRTGRASWSESCELHKVVTRRLYAGLSRALRLSAGRFIHATTDAQCARTRGRRRPSVGS